MSHTRLIETDAGRRCGCDRAVEPMSCGSLRVHDAHHWNGQTTRLPYHCPGADGVRCARCSAVERWWPKSDPLYRPGFSTCPPCTRADIDLDKRMERRTNA